MNKDKCDGREVGVEQEEVALEQKEEEEEVEEEVEATSILDDSVPHNSHPLPALRASAGCSASFM